MAVGFHRPFFGPRRLVVYRRTAAGDGVRVWGTSAPLPVLGVGMMFVAAVLRAVARSNTGYRYLGALLGEIPDMSLDTTGLGPEALQVRLPGRVP